MHALVSQAKERLGELEVGKKYCLVIPGPLGGEYGISNIITIPLLELIRFSGGLAKKIRDLPDGAEIKIQVTD